MSVSGSRSGSSAITISSQSGSSLYGSSCPARRGPISSSVFSMMSFLVTSAPLELGSDSVPSDVLREHAPDRLTGLVLMHVGNRACGSGLGQNLAADHIRRANFPFIVADADVLDNRIAAIIERIRDNALSLIRESAVDFSDYFSVVVANLHVSSP